MIFHMFIVQNVKFWFNSWICVFVKGFLDGIQVPFQENIFATENPREALHRMLRIPIEKGDRTDFHLYIPIFWEGQFKSVADGLIHCWNSWTYVYIESASNFIPLFTKPDQDQVNYIPRSAPPKISEVSIRTLGRWAFTRCHSWFTRGHSWFTSGQRENKNIGEEIVAQFRKKLLY